MKNVTALPALVPAGHGAVVCDDACRRVGLEEARKLFRSGEALVAHAAFVAGRLKIAPGKPLYDVLELFAFVRPGVPCVPSALGIARALGLGAPDTPEDAARTLRQSALKLLEEIAESQEATKAGLRPLVHTLSIAGWRVG